MNSYPYYEYIFSGHIRKELSLCLFGTAGFLDSSRRKNRLEEDWDGDRK